MKIYTKIGDKGETNLGNGSKTKKSSLRIDCYGTVDELNANISMLGEQYKKSPSTHPLHSEITKAIFKIQKQLFEIGAELALSSPLKNTKTINKEDVEVLETDIDKFMNLLPPLHHFVLPGGHLTNSQAHICRCVCRRAERILCKLNDEAPVRADLLVYFNRLSDWFFAVSRCSIIIFDIEELYWKGGD